MYSAINKKKNGFSLVELLIYGALLIIITFFIVQTTLNLIKSHSKISLNRSIEYSSVSTFDKMLGEIRGATSVNSASSIFGTNPGTLSLNSTDSSGDYTIVFSVTSGVLTFSKNGAASVPLTSSDVSVTNLIFRSLSTTTSEAIKIDISVSGTRGDYTKSIDLTSFAVLRGSY